jgi:hypothetical protein
MGLLAYFISARGVWVVLKDACSISVRTLIACICCIVRGNCWWAVAVQSLGVMLSGIMPSVLSCVTRLCRHLVPFNFLLVVGLLDVTMGGKSVMHGIVMIGVSLITLCSSICQANRSLFSTLRSSMGGAGCNKFSIFWARNFNNCFLLVCYLPPQ